MLTSADVASVPLFAELPLETLEHVARTAADLRLLPGEFAVPEGGERALFAVLSGKIEVVNIDGSCKRSRTSPSSSARSCSPCTVIRP